MMEGLAGAQTERRTIMIDATFEDAQQGKAPSRLVLLVERFHVVGFDG